MGKSLILAVLTTILLDSVLCLPPQLRNKHKLEVYGGDPAKPGQFPFIVAIIVDRTQNCDGSIINEKWVVTAAGCLADVPIEYLTILAGTNLYNSGGTVYNVDSYIYNADYDLSTNANDIGLIKIDGTFTFTELLQPIEIGEVADSDPVTVIGWGITESEGFPNELQYANLTVLSDEDCTKKSKGGDFTLPRGPGQVCAFASEGIGPCYGDYGGPLIFNGTLVGIASYDVSPCARGYPDVYTRTAYYVDWISENIANN